MKDCEKCWGTGHEIDHQHLGQLARAGREQAGLSLKDAATHLGISGCYLSLLERGKRAWSKPLWHKASR